MGNKHSNRARLFQYLLFLLLALSGPYLFAQAKKPAKKEASERGLPDIYKRILELGQANTVLYISNTEKQNENDVNGITSEMIKHIDSFPPSHGRAEALLSKHFAALKHFFLTTTNKTSVATSFIYKDAPYSFCTYNDTATALYLHAIKCGVTYDLSKVTERRAMKLALENCLVPALSSLDELDAKEIRYVALSVYYGCKDSRDGAGETPPAYCITLLARLENIQAFNSGLITAKGLVADGALYWYSAEDKNELRLITAP